MNTTSIISLIIFGVLSSIVLLTALFSPLARKIGFRNIARRWTNTILVVIGSLVGTALIAGSLVLSDSLDKTFLNLVKEQAGEADVIVAVKDKKFIPGLPVSLATPDEVSKVKESLTDESIDGVLPVNFFSVSPQKIDRQGKPILNAYGVEFFGLNFDEVRKFGQDPQNFPDISSPFGAYISQTLSENLEVKEGDRIRVPYGPLSIDLTVEKVYPDEGLVGGQRIVVDNQAIAAALMLPTDSYNGFVVSAKGGLKPDNYDGDKFKKKVDELLKNAEDDRIEFTTTELKSNALNGWGLKLFANIFLVLSMFGIFSGILLIINIYMMLAGERKYEMGILRAIALNRTQLTKTFVYEGFVYSILSSLLGTIVGLGVGYTLVKILGGMFSSIFEAVGMDGNMFKIDFDFKMSSLVTAFGVGASITLITAIIASYKISKLNIVSAIRNLEDEGKKMNLLRWILLIPFVLFIKPARFINWIFRKDWEESKFFKFLAKYFKVKDDDALRKAVRWSLVTWTSFVIFIVSFASFIFSFGVKSTFEEIRKQGLEGTPNSFSKMTETAFKGNVSVIQAYMFYVGAVLAMFFFSILVNRLVVAKYGKSIARGLATIFGVAAIVLTALMTKIDFIVDAFNQNSSIVLLFMGGLALVVSLSLVVTYNLNIVTAFFVMISRPVKSVNTVMKISMRYPAVNPARTGITLVMFALIIFLIAYISMVKVTMRQMNDSTVDKALGGYEALVMPSPELTETQLSEIEDKIKIDTDVSELTQVINVSIIMPDFKYKDLPKVMMQGPEAGHEDEDYFATTVDALPEDFIRKIDIKFEDKLSEYETDEEVWNTVFNDSSKVVLGQTFSAQSGMQRPNIKVGDKIKIADNFNSKSIEKEVIAIVRPESGMGFSSGLYSNVITTSENMEKDFTNNYINKFSSKEILVKFNEGVDIKAEVKSIKKELISYNIMFVWEMTELTKQAQGFIDGLMALMQGFLAFSLIVGASGLAIIMARSVHERKQQIGMLRSLGFQRWMVWASFFVESTFISFLGIIIGISMGTIGALNAFYAAFKDQPDVKPIFPVGEILVICILVYLATVLFSLLPSIRAAKLSPVEATNYPQ